MEYVGEKMSDMGGGVKKHHFGSEVVFEWPLNVNLSNSQILKFYEA